MCPGVQQKGLWDIDWRVVLGFSLKRIHSLHKLFDHSYLFFVKYLIQLKLLERRLCWFVGNCCCYLFFQQLHFNKRFVQILLVFLPGRSAQVEDILVFYFKPGIFFLIVIGGEGIPGKCANIRQVFLNRALEERTRKGV